MRRSKKWLIPIMLLSLSVYGQDLKIDLNGETRTEKITRNKLIRALEEYDLEKWMFTDTIRIVDGVIPHSHPILTLSTKPQSDLSLLATFVHENVHWFLTDNPKPTEQAIKALKKKYPNVPVGDGQGARDEYSSYLHLIVNFLEYDAIRQIAGERAATAVFKRKKYYKWIYAQVLENLEYFETLTEKHNLRL